MELTRLRTIAASLALCCVEAAAQSPADTTTTIQEQTDTVPKKEVSLLTKLLNRLTAPNKYFDPSYLRKPRPKLMLGLTGNLQQTGVHFDGNVFFDSSHGLYNATKTHIQLQGRVFRKVGILVNYSGLGVGLSTKLGSKDGEKSTSLFLKLTYPYYGISARYFNIREKARARMHAEVYSESGIETGEESRTSDYPADLREFQLDGYYAFNRKRFGYTAVYRSNVLQQRSAGSWMLGLKYLYGRVKFDHKETAFLNFIGGSSRFATHQLSLGGGYSYNLVLLHKDESGPHMRGLRNLTLNATFMPMLTVLNPITVAHDNKMMNELFHFDTERYTQHSRPRLNYTATAGMVFSIDRYSLNISATYDNFRFHTGARTEQLDIMGDHPQQISRMKGRFYNWNVGMQLRVRF
ncbi:MAG: DUF4421 family protein [Alloprevotella sp.]|nr:DUF4421 family protein [Alloprevotella sp.]